MARIEERLATLEERQKRHEEAIAVRQESHEETMKIHLSVFSQRLELVEDSQVTINETMQGVKTGLDTLISRMEKEQEVKDAVNADRRKRKMDLKDWVVLLSGLTVAASALLGTLK